MQGNTAEKHQKSSDAKGRTFAAAVVPVTIAGGQLLLGQAHQPVASEPVRALDQPGFVLKTSQTRREAYTEKVEAVEHTPQCRRRRRR